MKQKYKVVMKDGTTHRAYEIEHKPGFVQLMSWDGETRYPAGDVEKIYSSKAEGYLNNFILMMFGIIIMLLLFTV